MAEKIGVYFDQANIPLLNLEELAEFVKNKWDALCPVVKIVPYLASKEGRDEIQGDLDSGEIDSVLVVGSSPRLDWEFFDFGPKVLVDRVNLREQCVWCYKNPDGSVPQPGDEPPELLTLMAKDYLAMGVVKLQNSKVPEPEAFETAKTIMVLGGGWTGLTAALDAAATGYSVVLIEKENELGGFAAKMYKTVPLGHPYTETGETGIDKKIAAVQSSDKITVHTGTRLKALKGMPGQYEAVLSNGQTLKIGSVVLATGWRPQEDEYLKPIGYGSVPNVITTMEMEKMAKDGNIVRPGDGKTPESVVFLINVNSAIDRKIAQEEAAKAAAEAAAAEAEGEEGEEKAEEKKQEEKPKQAEGGEEGEEEEAFTFEPIKTHKHLEYSSEINTLTALKQAGYVREKNPEAISYVVYEHMMVPGINEKYYKAAQDDPGVMLSKGELVDLSANGDGGVIVILRNTLLGELIELKADMVVLPTGMEPTTADDPILQFQYRQGPAFPDLDLFDGFADSNYICFPYETRRTGVYAAGCVRQPMLMSLAEDDAAGAALKAIQCIESVNRGMAVHPRSGDMSYPKFNMVRCTQCKRCTEECPFGALDEDEKSNPMPNITRCRRCGTCMGACPERVISFDNYNIGQIGAMVKEVKVPDDMAVGGPRAIILACENDAYPALDMAAQRGLKWSPYVRIIPVRCLGSVNTIWIADAMSKGNDGVMLLGCKYGEDYQCHFVKGSELCNRRMDNVAESLGRLGVEIERVKQYQVAIDEYDKIPEMIDDFIRNVLKLGPNPFKGY